MRLQPIRPTQKTGTWGKHNPPPKKPKTVGKTRFKEDMLKLLTKERV